ncbi:MAG: ABC transporter permease [Ectothiorhodospiraceae bacterium]|nr:ABC transporter permease [Chromatiales bacterium]MCP5155637.1 ABC transporter permease [Ectothiorhodospiraceae bacterium]
MSTSAPSPARARTPLADIGARLWAHRELTWEFVKRDVRDRHAGQALGALWAFGHPIFLLALYVTLFAFVFQMRAAGAIELPRDFTVYILAGLVPWLTFQEVLVRACTAISANDSLVKQIVFPIEILPVKVVLGSFLSQLVSLAVVTGYLLVTDNAIPATYALLPLLCVVQIAAMVGVCYALAAVGVFLRDIKDMVTVFNAANLFMQPILFQPEVLPAPLRAVIYANPFSHIAFCYQDAMYYGDLVHPWSWLVLAVGSVLALGGGFWFFRRLAPYFGNVL